MKTKFFLTAAMVAMSLAASAQFTDSSTGTSANVGNAEGWDYGYVEYNPVTIKVDQKGVDDESVTAFSFGYSKAFPISQGTPLFVEAGLAAMYATKSDWYDQDDVNFSMISAKIPVNLMYAFQLQNSDIAIIPFGGVTLRGNIVGTITDKSGKKDKEYNVFDKKDMGSSDATWNRFQFGWQVGVKARLGGGFMLGLSYGSDMSEIAKKTTLTTTSIMVGYSF